MNISPRHFPLLLVILAFSIRVLYFYQFQENPFFDHLPDKWDQTTFHNGGKAFSEGNPLALAPGEPNQQSPLYQYFLGVVYFIFGADLKVAWFAQFTLGILSTLLVFAIARQYFNPAVGLVAGVLFTFYGGNWFYEGTLYRASLITFLELLSCLLLMRFAGRPSFGTMAASAAALSLVTQARSNYLLLVPFALFYLWSKVFSRPGSGKKFLAGYMIVFLFASAPLLVWVKQVHGSWGFYDRTGGENVYLANSLDSPVRRYRHIESYKDLTQSARLETAPAASLILEAAREHPLEVAGIYMRKLYYYFNNYEVPTSHNFYLSGEFAPVLSWGSIPFGLIGTLGLTGFFWSFRKLKRWTLPHAFFTANVLMYLPFLVLSRYRLSIVPFLCMFSAFALWMGLEALRKKNWRALSVAGTGILVLGFCLRTDPLPEGKVRILDYINMGSAYLNNSDPRDDRKGYEFYKRGWDLSRSLPPELRKTKTMSSALRDYYIKEADRSRLVQDFPRESEALKKALYFDFSSVRTHALYAHSLSRGPDPQQALVEALRSVTMAPDFPDEHLFLGVVYIQNMKRPLWGMFHLLKARNLSGSSARPALDNLIGTMQIILKNEYIHLPAEPHKALTPLTDLLRKRSSPPIDFPYNLTLPPEVSGWPAQEAENYRIRLYHHLILQPETNPAPAYYQLGMMAWKVTGDENSAFYYFEKAWDNGLQFPALASLLNFFTEQSATRPIPWEKTHGKTSGWEAPFGERRDY